MTTIAPIAGPGVPDASGPHGKPVVRVKAADGKTAAPSRSADSAAAFGAGLEQGWFWQDRQQPAGELPAAMLAGWQMPAAPATLVQTAATVPHTADVAAFGAAMARQLEAPMPAAPGHAVQQVDVHLTQRWHAPMHVASVTRTADGSIALSLPAAAGAAPLPPLVTLPPRLRAMLDAHGRPRPDAVADQRGKRTG